MPIGESVYSRISDNRSPRYTILAEAKNREERIYRTAL
jgi:hypothetical protein